MNTRSRILTAGATIALLAAPVAAAKPDKPPKPDKPHGNGQAKGASYVFKGTYVDATTVDVAKGNSRVRKNDLLGAVQFDFSAAKIRVADTNGDGSADLADVVAGDKVVVKVKAPRQDPGPQPFAARQLVDQTNAEVEEPATVE